MIGEELQVVAIALDGLIGRALHDVMFVGQPRPAHVLRLREFAAADLRLRPGRRRYDQPLKRDADDQEKKDTSHGRTQATEELATEEHGRCDLLGRRVIEEYHAADRSKRLNRLRQPGAGT